MEPSGFYDPEKLVAQLQKELAKLKDHQIVEIKVGDLRAILTKVK